MSVCKAAIDIPAAPAQPVPDLVAANLVQPSTPHGQTPSKQASSKQTSNKQAPDKIEVQCFCGVTLRAPAARAGTTIDCPKCQMPLTIPNPNASDSSAPAALNDDFFGSALADLPAAAPPANAKADADFWNSTLAPAGSSADHDKPSNAKPALTNPYSNLLSGAEASAVSSALALNNKADEPSTWRSYKPILICLVLVVGGPMLAISGCKNQQELALLKAEGVEVDGTITEAESRRRRRSTSYYFDVTYLTKEGSAFSHSFSVSSTEFHKHCDATQIVDDKVLVTYAASDPNVARLAGDTSNPAMMTNIGIFLTALGVIGTGLFGWLLIR